MKLEKTIGIAALGFLLLGACGEKKPEKPEDDTTATEAAKKEMSQEAAKKEAELRAAKIRVEDSLRRVDSLRQVKEHGHAH